MVDIADSKWSEIPEGNDAPSPNGIQSGYSPKTVRPILQEMRAATKRWYNRSNAFYLTTGTGAAYVLTLEVPLEVYTKGERFAFFASVSNVGPATFNISGLGAKSILRGDGTPLVAGDIAAGNFTELVYDGTAFRVVNAAGASFSGNVTAGTFIGSGAALTNLNAAAITSGTLPNARLVGTYDFQSLTLSSTLNTATLTVDSTGQPTMRLRKAGIDAGVIYSDGSNNLVIRKHDPATGAAQGYFRIDGNGASDGKFNGSTLWTDANVTTAIVNNKIGYTPVSPTQLNNAVAPFGSMAERNLTVSTANPSGGVDGDVWFKV